MPITASTKVSELLKEYPELLDTLVDYSPAFARLRNPLMRKTFARMATLAQAAAIGGVEVNDLLNTLRQAAGEPVGDNDDDQLVASPHTYERNHHIPTQKVNTH